ncbi:hypothetical protein PF005_g7820 [Phytophthora fragariae]|uniref:Uncharacterized protein n=1 Tax=Phytophthora fragariae TaxID=53985 RepID=A0A6A3ELV4_9STRA|nr:hypothetical protein PF003_g37079 [Phytophthora fragariae]KAE8934479.1 hypothetical protein PF009_g15546 [Phytophthora fragariae]KAE9001957.1 hypothetical protein PF011_g13514 [Phytophthora fragariae]KAE9121834.1 hypothetical protein PF010_g6954 [Phytophthora fragariae]KAE9122022.1 hypothetical protein PF007_g7605 [Phytophthora fragariae]
MCTSVGNAIWKMLIAVAPPLSVLLFVQQPVPGALLAVSGDGQDPRDCVDARRTA